MNTRILVAFFYLNIAFFIGGIVGYILLLGADNYEEILSIQDSVVYRATYLILIIPTFLLWIDNIVYFYKHDRYSKAIFLLFFLNFLYSPIYFYRVRWKEVRPLKNEIPKKESNGASIKMEDYEDDNEFDEDVIRNLE